MNVNSTIEVVNTSESIKQALQNEYRGCEVNEAECTVLIDGILYGYDLIKHMDEVDLSLYSIYELDKDSSNTNLFALIITSPAQHEGFSDTIIAVDPNADALEFVAKSYASNHTNFETMYIKPIILGEIINYDDMTDVIMLPYSNGV